MALYKVVDTLPRAQRNPDPRKQQRSLCCRPRSEESDKTEKTHTSHIEPARRYVYKYIYII